MKFINAMIVMALLTMKCVGPLVRQLKTEPG
jgi:hypothetical protein